MSARVRDRWHSPAAVERRTQAERAKEALRLDRLGHKSAPLPRETESPHAKIIRLRRELREAAKRWGLELRPITPEDASFSLCRTAAGYTPDELGPKVLAWLEALADTLPEDCDDGGGT